MNAGVLAVGIVVLAVTVADTNISISRQLIKKNSDLVLRKIELNHL
ncbi:hypothetical protein [Candidatus Trichorickettsia mobilis]|nr:hypothetical protein [Candidatus Trichorickettsia mobilis]